MTGPAVDIVGMLATAGVVSAIGTDAFVGRNAKLPNGDGPYVSVVELQGGGDEPTHDRTDKPYEAPELQVVARAMSASAARAKAAAAKAALRLARNTAVNGTFYLWVRTGSLFELPADDASRARYAFNVSVKSVQQ